MKLIVALTSASLIGLAVLPTAGDANPPRKATIIHSGDQITVSCNALDGHLQHADKIERSTIRKAIVKCRVRTAATASPSR